ncbi:MAG: transcriptional repressor [Desulfobulbaceae bacterium]|nr:transcriptional repressor [Desulfobulbaceae bacterium]
MCQNCNYQKLLEQAGIDATANRIQILEAIGSNNYPLTAADVFKIVHRVQSINRVTVYRILDLLVENDLVERLRIGSRAAYYGLAPNENHAAHPHFYCIECGHVDCLQAKAINIDADVLKRTFPGEIIKMDVRVEGICKNCLKQKNH